MCSLRYGCDSRIAMIRRFIYRFVPLALRTFLIKLCPDEVVMI